MKRKSEIEAEEKNMIWKLKLILSLVKKAVTFEPSYLPLRMAQTLFEILTPFLIAVPPALILDKLIAHDDLPGLVVLVGITVLLEGLSALTRYLLGHRIRQAAFVINQKIELTINEAFMRMEYVRLEDPKVQDLSQLARDANNRASSLESMIGTFFSMIGQAVSLAGMAAILSGLILTDRSQSGISGIVGWLAENGLLCLLAALFLCLLSSKMNGILNKIYGHYDKKFASLGREYKYYGQLAREEAYAKDIRAFRLYDLIDKRIQRYMERNRQLTDEVNVAEVSAGVAGGLLMAFEMIVVYAMVSCKVMAGFISVGEFYMYVTAVTQAIGLVKGLLENKNSIDRCLMYQRAYLDIERLAGERQKQEVWKFQGGTVHTVAFEHVTFTYPGAHAPALYDVSFTLREGEKLALVGRNGSGKTTIVKLMLGLYTPQQGRILLNGQDIKSIPYEEYIRCFGAVFQDFKLIAASVAENVAMEEQGDLETVRHCLEDAGLQQFLSGLKNGLDTQLMRNFNKESVSPSGGEAQKIAIARAFYKKAPVLVLDEPTAALDPVSERNMFEVVQKKLKAGQAAVFISHRLSSCRLCDRILTINEGRIVQEGAHDSLVKQEGLYKTMWDTQKNFYVKDGA